MHLSVRLDVTKIDKTALYPGKDGRMYLNLVLLEKRSIDTYGNTYGVKQDLGMARKGEQSVFIGDAKPIGKGITQAPPQNNDNDDIPF